MNAPLEQDVIRTSQRLFLAQAALDTLEMFSAKLLNLTPRAAGAGEFLYHVLASLESTAASSKERPVIPLYVCEENHRIFAAAPLDGIRHRPLFAAHLLTQFASYTHTMTAADAKQFEKAIEAALRYVATD
jgi:hypothetical protein